MEKKKGHVIVITSSKGGVGKTILTLNLAGIYEQLQKKVLILDFDLGTGAIALNLNLSPEKTLYQMTEDIKNHTFQDYKNYLTTYDDQIDVIASPKDPRQATKIDSKYLEMVIQSVSSYYDVVLIDTTHGLHGTNIVSLDQADMILYVVTNDWMDLKNTRAFMSIMNDIEMQNVRVVLNCSKDPNLNYFGNFDLKNIMKHNIDYTVSSGLYIKNITKYLLEGKIFTLNHNLVFRDKKDLKKFQIMAKDLIGEEE